MQHLFWGRLFRRSNPVHFFCGALRCTSWRCGYMLRGQQMFQQRSPLCFSVMAKRRCALAVVSFVALLLFTSSSRNKYSIGVNPLGCFSPVVHCSGRSCWFTPRAKILAEKYYCALSYAPIAARDFVQWQHEGSRRGGRLWVQCLSIATNDLRYVIFCVCVLVSRRSDASVHKTAGTRLVDCWNMIATNVVPFLCSCGRGKE